MYVRIILTLIEELELTCGQRTRTRERHHLVLLSTQRKIFSIQSVSLMSPEISNTTTRLRNDSSRIL